MADVIKNEQDINTLFKYHDDKIGKLHEIEVRQVEIAGDVEHIRGRLDNGMSHTLARIDKNLAELLPVIEHHASIVKRIEDFGWAITRWVSLSLVVSILGITAWAIANGYTIK